MAEELILTTPIVPLTNSKATLEEFYMNWPNRKIHVSVRLNDGSVVDYEETGLSAEARMRTINKSNFSVKSLVNTVLEYISSKRPELAGTVVGTPE